MGSWTGTVPAFAALQKIRAPRLQTLADIATALTAAWTPYVPTWTASAGSPSIGNGTLAGAYRRVGKTLDFQVDLLYGSSSSAGTGGAYWLLSLPSGMTAARHFHGAGHYLETGATEYQCTWRVVAGATVLEFFRESARLTNTSPIAVLSTGDRLTASGTIEIT